MKRMFNIVLSLILGFVSIVMLPAETALSANWSAPEQEAIKQINLESTKEADAVLTQAALPPKYLEVKDFKKCLAEKDMGTYSMWCLPANKPEACPKESWEQLNNLTGQDKVPSC